MKLPLWPLAIVMSATGEAATAGPASKASANQTSEHLTRIADRPKCASCGRPILLDRPIAVTDATLDAVLKGTEVPVVLDGYADWCGPCKIMAPVLDDFARDRQGEVLVVKLDTDRNPATTHRFGIRAIPTLLVFRQGQEVGRQTGVIPRQRLEALAGLSGPAT